MPSCARSHRSGATAPVTRPRTPRTTPSSTVPSGSCWGGNLGAASAVQLIISIVVDVSIFQRTNLDPHDLARRQDGAEVRQIESAIGTEGHVAGRKGQPRQD